MNRGTIIFVAVTGLGLAGLTTWRVAESLTRRAAASVETAPVAVVPVDAIAAAPRDMVETVRVAGTLRALHEADVIADVPGRVVAMLVEVGAPVKKGEALARLEQRDLSLQVEQAAAGLAAAEAGQDAAARDLSGAAAVLAVGGVTEAQMVGLKSRADAANAQVKQAKAGLALARARLDDANLRSPIDGVVTKLNTDIGRMVTPGAPVFTVADLSSMELEVAVDERAAARVKVGDAVGVLSESVTDQIAPGTVRSVSPALDPVTRKATVIVSLAWQPGLLPHGAASARFTLGQAAGVIAVPAQAILEDQGESFVYLMVDGKAHRQVVQRGIRESDWVQVQGVDAGASVIVTGNNFLTEGTAVTPRSQEPS